MFLEFCQKLNFPQESFSVLEKAYMQIKRSTQDELNAAHASLFTPGDRGYLEHMQTISEKTGIHRYTSDMAVLISAVEQLLPIYEEKGLPPQLMWDSLEDLRYKLLECYQNHGLWGTFVPHWFQRFYVLQCFKLGRLEFEKIGFKWDVPGIPKGTPVINIHIPSCGPLGKNEIEASLNLACQFYKSDFDGKIPFVCNSWMLYPPIAEQVFAPNSNLLDFYERFTIMQYTADLENKDFWRIFNHPYSEENLRIAPKNTKLQKSILTYLCAGNTLGTGIGIFYK